MAAAAVFGIPRGRAGVGASAGRVNSAKRMVNAIWKT